MNEIIIVLGSACLAVLFVASGIPLCIKKRIWGASAGLHRIKPFDCEMCLAFWLGIAGAIFFETKSPNPIYMGGISSILAVFITKKIE